MFQPAARSRGLSVMDFHGGRQSGRFMLWVDVVGGFWVCTGDELVLGQPVHGAAVDIPILGDISGRHARICRDQEGYLIEAIREVRLDGRRVDKMDVLADGSRITLGQAVRLSFRRPHALSATARLDFLSPHRTQPTADAVLLMADALILGPGPRSHVVCRNWPQEVVLCRHQGRLLCRTAGPLEIDGAECTDRGYVTMNSHVEGRGFSFSLEEIGR